MDYRDSSGKVTGFAIDLMSEAARRENLSVIWVHGVGIDENDEALRTGKVDVIMTGAATPDRHRVFYVSNPWWSDDLVAIVPANSAIRQESDLAGKRLATSNTASGTLIRRIPSARMVRRPGAIEAVSSACSGEADAAIIQSMFLRELLGAPPTFCATMQLRTIDLQISREYVLIARAERANVGRALYAQLNKMTLDGTVAAIATRYPPISTSEATRLTALLRVAQQDQVTRLILVAAFIGFAVSAAFIFWQRQLTMKLRKVNLQLAEGKSEQERSLAQRETILDTLSEGVFVYNLNGDLAYWNRVAREFHEQLIPASPDGPAYSNAAAFISLSNCNGEVIAPDDYPRQRILRGEQIRDLEVHLTSRQIPETRILLISGALARDRSGVPFAAVVSTKDITEKRRAEQDLERRDALLRAVCDSTPDSIYVKDVDGHILLANPALLNAIGKKPEEAIGKSLPEIFADSETAAISASERRILEQGEAETIEETVGGPTASKVWLTTKSVWRETSGKVLGLIGISRDITERKQTGETARHWQRVFEQAEIAIALEDAGTDTLRDVNESFARQRGYRREELLGTSILKSYPPGDADSLAAHLREADEKSHTSFEARHVRKDGTIFPVLVDITVVKNAAGELTSRVAFIRDLTEVKRAHAEILQHQQRIALAQHAAHFGVFDWDIRDRTTLWSDEMKALYGLHPSESTGTLEAWMECLVPDDRPALERLALDAKRNPEILRQFRIKRQDDQQVRWMEILGDVFYGEDGAPSRMIGINTDITERKRADEEILRLNLELEDRVRSRTSQLERANQELEAFSYSVSHDLRAPLRGIDGWSLALLEDYGSQLDSTAKGYLDRVRAQAQRMGGLIDDLLNLSRLNRTSLKVGTVDLTMLASTVFQSLLEMEAGRTIHFAVEPELVASGDRALLEVALTNLLSNALKFTSRRDVARITFGSTVDGQQTVFFVRDNGAGFDMAHAGVLFGVFQRLHRESEFPGTGVGLATVQRIIHRHGGKIWAEAEPGNGATFYFTIGTCL